MRPGLLVSGRHSLPLVSVLIYRPCRSYRSRLAAAGSFRSIRLGNHLCTCTAHSGAKKAHDWAVAQIADLFRTSHKVKTQQVARSWGQRCGDIELAGYLANAAGPVQQSMRQLQQSMQLAGYLATPAAGPVPLVLDLRIAHERWGSSSDPTLNGHLHYPNDVDRQLNAADKIRAYRADYNNRPSNAISFLPAIASTSGRLHS
jgi:hypothetical protein